LQVFEVQANLQPETSLKTNSKYFLLYFHAVQLGEKKRLNLHL